MQHPICGLYAITVDGSDNLINEVEQALLGGASVVQYRDKSSDAIKRMSQATALRALCQKFSACFIVNDDVELAIEVDADGLHIGADDGDIRQIRNRMKGKILGVSCYNRLELAQELVKSGADYVAFGRFFLSNTKPNAVPANIELLRKAKQILQVPVVAIGGITLHNAKTLIDEGADAIAVIDGLFKQGNIKQTAQEFTNLFQFKKFE